MNHATTVDAVRVEHHMTRSPRCVPPEMSLVEAQRVLGELGVRHAPVVDGGALVGLLDARAFCAAGAHGAHKVADVMVRNPLVVSPRDLVEEIAADMLLHVRPCALVVDDGALIGVFTTRDARSAMARLGIACPTPRAPTSDRWGHVVAPGTAARSD